uniref:Uncharacterized protein n=1 Tax=Davidia involucrata TaxID=16924 RepID=A0A5B6YXT5_DAVIN
MTSTVTKMNHRRRLRMLPLLLDVVGCAITVVLQIELPHRSPSPSFTRSSSSLISKNLTISTIKSHQSENFYIIFEFSDANHGMVPSSAVQPPNAPYISEHEEV